MPIPLSLARLSLARLSLAPLSLARLSLLVLPLLLPPAAGAATLGLDTLPAPVVSGPGESFNEPGFGFLLLGDDAAEATPPTAATALSLIVPYADLVAGLGAIFVTDPVGAEFLSGDLADVGFITGPGEDVIELLFRNLSGAAATAYGWGALLEVSGEFGADPIGTGFGSFLAPEAVGFTLKPALAPVPVGPALGFLVPALGALMALGRVRARRS